MSWSIAARIIFVTGSALNSSADRCSTRRRRAFRTGSATTAGCSASTWLHHVPSCRRRRTHRRLRPDKYFFGRRPTECILANFRNLGKQETDFVGGYTTFTGAYRERGEDDADDLVGRSVQETPQTQPGPWEIYMYMQGETIPKESNHVRLHET